MVLDAAKGIEEGDPETLQGLPIARCADHHFYQQLDRGARDPFDLLDEVEQSLALDVTPASWPIGMGLSRHLRPLRRSCYSSVASHHRVTEPVRCSGLDDPQLPRLSPKEALAKFRGEVEMAKGCARDSTRRPIARSI